MLAQLGVAYGRALLVHRARRWESSWLTVAPAQAHGLTRCTSRSDSLAHVAWAGQRAFQYVAVRLDRLTRGHDVARGLGVDCVGFESARARWTSFTHGLRTRALSSV